MTKQPQPQHFILHISDTHFVTDGDLLYGTVDTDEMLRQIFRSLVKAQITPEAMVFTGDLAETGSPEAYVRLRNIVEPIAKELGATIIWVMGNHDERSAFRAGLLDSEASEEAVDLVHDINGLRVIALDTTVPGKHYGEVTEEQLSWLEDVLATPAPHGTLIALHHPPVPSPLDVMAAVELRDQDRLAKVIEGTDVRGILGGHLHYSCFSTFASVPVAVASATCYTQDLNVPKGQIRGQNGAQALNLVHVYPDRILSSVVPIGEFSTLYEMSKEELIEELAEPSNDETGAGCGEVSKTEIAPATGRTS